MITCQMSSNIGGHQSSPWDSVQVIVFSRVGGPPEHVEHARGDGEATANVDG